MSVNGRIHSIETCGTVDGPGIRFVVFLQGCPLRCQYCHNPDTWNTQGGTSTTVAELMQEILLYKSYLKASGGGVTVSGGEPLLQAEFVAELFAACKNRGIHTALDTSGFSSLEKARPALDASDLVLLDMKAHDPHRFREITGADIGPVRKVLDYLRAHGTPVWIRFVQVPGLTDDLEDIRAMAAYLAGFENIQKVEVNPFHKMGEYKWQQLGLAYTLGDTPAADPRDVERTKAIFAEAGLYAP